MTYKIVERLKTRAADIADFGGDFDYPHLHTMMAECNEAASLIQELGEALEPFNEMLSVKEAFFNETQLRGIADENQTEVLLLWGDLRRARSILSKLKDES